MASAQAQTEGPSAIRVESQQVVVPVFVVDKSDVRIARERGYLEELDTEVTGLAAKDFHVFEDGIERGRASRWTCREFGTYATTSLITSNPHVHPGVFGPVRICRHKFIVVQVCGSCMYT